MLELVWTGSLVLSAAWQPLGVSREGRVPDTQGETLPAGALSAQIVLALTGPYVGRLLPACAATR